MSRHVAGYLNGVDDIRPGTIVGPKDTTGEYLVALEFGENDFQMDRTSFAYATQEEILLAVARAAGGDPWSLAELALTKEVSNALSAKVS